MKIVIAGASGFVGRELCHVLAKRHEVIGLTRQPVPAAAPQAGQPLWRQASIFSLLALERALAGADLAVYLVHSMSPPSSLTQGSFEDLDLILADNFARAARLNKVKRIIYLSGIIPDDELSPHLESRFEVERTLASQGMPVVTLRAGLIIGRDGSSYKILDKLIDRLPFMLCPKWTTSKSQPIALQDVIAILTHVVDDQDLAPGAYDIAGADTLTYVDMMRQVAAIKQKRRLFLDVPFVSPHLSRLWVSTVTQTPRALIYPLIESLRHDMVARDTALQRRYQLTPLHFKEAVAAAQISAPVAAPVQSRTPVHLKLQKKDPMVTSVQRLQLPQGRSPHWLVTEFSRWVPLLMAPIIRVDAAVDGSLKFCFWRWSLLELTYSPERSSPTRELYYVTGGMLLRRRKSAARGRLEFRIIPGKDQVMAAVLDYRPRLPWRLYKITQAKVHLWVMRLFAWHLASLARANKKIA